MDKLAVMTFMFEPWCAASPAGHERLLAGLAALGIHSVEPPHTPFVSNAGLTARYAKALRDNGMQAPVVDVMCDLVHSSPAEMRRGRDALRRGLELCAALGTGIAHVAGHSPKTGIPLPDARKMVAHELSREAEFAAKHGVTLAIEDFGISPTLLCRAEDCLETLRHVGGKVRFVFDIGNFEFVGEHADENVESLYGYTCHVHVKDWQSVAWRTADGSGEVRAVGCPLGSGVVPAAKALSLLKSKGYDGRIALEITSLLDDPFATVERDMAVLRRWLA